MSLPSYALTTLARVKDRAGIPSGTTTYDTALERLIVMATALIERTCNGRRFFRTTYTSEVYDLDGGEEVLYLKNWPVSALTTVQYNIGTPGTPSWTTEVVDNYALADAGEFGRVRLYSGYSGVNAARVTYSAGYLIDWTNEFTATHTLPFELTDLCERITLASFNKRTDEGKASQSSQETSVTWEKVRIPEGDMEWLRVYQRPRFA